MRVVSIRLENFRAFVGVHRVRVHPKLTVLVGLNGAGKSAVLDALAANLSATASIMAGSNQSWMKIGDPANIAVGQDWAKLATTVQRGDDGPNTTVQNCVGEAPGRTSLADGEKPFGFLHVLGDAIASEEVVLPFLGYLHSGSTRTPQAHKPMGNIVGRLEAWKGAFDSESIQFDALEPWFEQEENLENQKKIESKKLGLELPSLRALRKAVRTFLEVLHGSRLGKMRVVRFHKEALAPAVGKLVIMKGESELFLAQLSDGERRLVLLVADAARRMVILNPKLSDPLTSPGVMLIDEIELHLHPQWQRRVLPALRATFPELQLIVSTHAPATLSTVPNESVVVLHEGKVLEGTPKVFGLDVNSILAGAMNTPSLPEAIQAKVDEIYRLVDEDAKGAEAAIDVLAAEVGQDHPELVRARALLTFVAG